MLEGSTSTDSPAVKFSLLVTAGTWGSQPITPDSVGTCCLCHTHTSTPCTKVLFAIPAAEFALLQADKTKACLVSLPEALFSHVFSAPWTVYLSANPPFL